MDIYEKLTYNLNDEYKIHLENIDNIDVDLFNEEKIFAFAKCYDLFTDEISKKIQTALYEIKNDRGYSKLSKALYYFIKNNLGIDVLKPDFSKGIKPLFVMFFPVWYMAQEFSNDLTQRKVDREIIKKTLNQIIVCLENNKSLTGVLGISSQFNWITKYAKGELFKINDFEYELGRKDGDNMVKIHIPKNTKLDVLNNLKSFNQAVEFFDTYYKEYNVKGVMCESWLLSDEIREVMGRETNISRFGDMFTKYDVGENGDAVFRFVYNLVEPCKDLNTLSEETTLQKNIKSYLLLGKKVYAKGGIIKREDIKKRIKQLDNANN